MHFSTAAALLFGLGTRIAIDKFSNGSVDDPSSLAAIGDAILLGLAQGVALYYALMEFADLAFVVGFGIAVKMIYDFAHEHDVVKCATTLLGAALGVLVTDILSQLIEDGYFYDFYGEDSSDNASVYAATKRKRLVKFQSTDTEYATIPPSKSSRSRRKDPERRWKVEPPSSLSSNSDILDPTHSMNPGEREVAALRARASLADSERRRFKEEKKWAVSQGNMARASQMSWQVKRYTALTQSFTREADARFLEVSANRPQQQSYPASTSQHPERHVERHTNHSRHSAQEVTIDRNSTVTLDVGGRHRKQSSSNLKSAIRLQVR
ncbi:hypothetical protein BJ138DRAFT_1081076 [Hygrophoropsis aurantiaca]|uniref:Uncharacterized protein n=1 Tax=Hygrophoropsis aurantiaca TaxID=72124 RepID=A0ACB8AKY7_9AGAM|nr:hypothetical protein BJ138DRAFT_1081076 [Hygrophoropsis aurantiaca]